MAESFMFSIAETLLWKLSSFALQEVLLAWGLENDVEKIKEMLLAIKAVLLDAEQQQTHNQRIEFWLGKLKDVLYDAEDVLDEVECEALRRQVVKSRSISRKVRRLFSSSNSLAIRFKMAHKLKQIRERVAEIAALKSDFSLTERVNDRQVIPREREMTHSFVNPEDVVGREEDKEEILERLLNVVNGENVSILPIVGIGGLGKTTLAKLMYNDQRVDTHFDKKLWVCVSEDFDLQKVIIKILKSATGQKYPDLDIDQLQSILHDILEKEKYLLILDDVWNEDRRKWLELKALLMGGANGSKIVVTTRSTQVASIMGTIPAYVLNDLPHNNCLSLFFKCAFKDKQEEEQYPNLIKIGEDIVRKCKGVPLAVITLGTLLYSKTKEHDWKSIRDSEIWKLKQNDSDILPILRLSYDQLSSHLKRCFVYCSFYPKDYEFQDFELIQFWMAHGLLQSTSEDEDLEDVGMHYLNELKSRSFFQVFKHPFVEILYFKMHDLVHDLALSLIQSECAVVTSSTRNIFPSVRHLLFHDRTSLPESLHVMLQGLDNVKTILCINLEKDLNSQLVIDLCLSRFQYLRMLTLSNSGIEVLSENIGTLKHLRFLDLSENSKIKKLTNSICNLQNLQTLSIGGCVGIEELPGDIRYMISLRCLDLTTKQKRFSKNGIWCLKSLRFLAIMACENLECLCEDIQGLTSLQTLIIGNCKSLISLPQSMKYLTAIKTLIIINCQSLDLPVEEGNDSNDFSRFGLQTLELMGLPKLVNLPQWLLQRSTNTLQCLTLVNCENLKELPPCLQNIASLQKLEIASSDKLVDRCQYGKGEDWFKIAHIPRILLDNVNIQSTNNDD